MKRIFFSKSGQGILEYSVIFVVIVGILIVAVSKALKPQTKMIYQTVGNKMDKSTGDVADKIGAGTSFPSNVIVD